jgi:hypothetical protein
MGDWLTVREAAALIPRDERTIRRWCGPGGPLHTIALRDTDGQWRVPQEWVDAWLAEHTEAEAEADLPVTEQYGAVIEALREEIKRAVRAEMGALRQELLATRKEMARRDELLIAALQEAKKPWWRKVFQRFS